MTNMNTLGGEENMDEKRKKLEYIKSLDKTQQNTLTNKVYKVPTADIDFDNYLPTKWGVEYHEINGEAQELEYYMLNGLNFLIEGDKGLGKTQLVHNLCVKHNIPIVPLASSEGTRIGDLIGRPQINEFGSYFHLGVLPTAIEVANHFGHAVLYMDEFNALTHELQKATNSITDGRRSIVANGKTYRLNDGVILSVIATMNPSTYAGVNTLTEESRSRFAGAIWEYPKADALASIIDWSGIPQETAVNPMLTLTQNIHNLRINNEVDYSLSPRDLAQFADIYRMWKHALDNGMTRIKPLDKALMNTVLCKFGASQQREVVKKQIREIFGVTL